MNKLEACELLHISESTLQRRLRAKKYTCTRTGEGQYAPISFTYADLGLTEPTPEPMPVVTVPAPAPVPDISEPDAFSPRPLTAEERDADYAARYKAGAATDSIGNKIDGTNERFITKGVQSLLGPVEIERTPVDTQSHMNAALLSDHDSTGNEITGPIRMSCVPSFVDVGFGSAGSTRGGSPLAPGLSQETYDKMMNDWRKAGGGRSMSEQEQQIRRAKQNIHRSFPRCD